MITDTYAEHVWQAEEYRSNSSTQSIAATDLLQYIKLKGDEKVLDVGCGDGKITATIANYLQSGSVLGIDISPEMIVFAKKTFPKDRYSNLTFLLQNAQQLNYFEQFDVIFSSFALQWLPDEDAFFKGAYNSLKPSGYLALTIPLGISSALEQAITEKATSLEWSEYFQNFQMLPSKNNFTKDTEFEQFLYKNNFKPIRFETISQEVIFSNRADFEKYVLQWFYYSKRIPDNLKQVFFKQVIDRYLEIEPILINGKILFKFSRLDIVANKIIL